MREVDSRSSVLGSLGDSSSVSDPVVPSNFPLLFTQRGNMEEVGSYKRQNMGILDVDLFGSAPPLS